jgi:hypothetical protein
VTWSYIARGDAVTASSDDVAVAEPAGCNDGDLMIVGIALRGTAAISAPVGWTVVSTALTGDSNTSSGIAGGMLAFRSRSGDAGATFTRTGGDVTLARMVAYRTTEGGFSLSEQAHKQEASNTSNPFIDLSSWVPVTGNKLVVALFSNAGNSAPTTHAFNVDETPTSSTIDGSGTSTVSASQPYYRHSASTAGGARSGISIWDGLITASTSLFADISSVTNAKHYHAYALFEEGAGGGAPARGFRVIGPY